MLKIMEEHGVVPDFEIAAAPKPEPQRKVAGRRQKPQDHWNPTVTPAPAPTGGWLDDRW